MDLTAGSVDRQTDRQTEGQTKTYEHCGILFGGLPRGQTDGATPKKIKTKKFKEEKMKKNLTIKHEA